MPHVRANNKMFCIEIGKRKREKIVPMGIPTQYLIKSFGLIDDLRRIFMDQTQRTFKSASSIMRIIFNITNTFLFVI